MSRPKSYAIATGLIFLAFVGMGLCEYVKRIADPQFTWLRDTDLSFLFMTAYMMAMIRLSKNETPLGKRTAFGLASMGYVGVAAFIMWAVLHW